MEVGIDDVLDLSNREVLISLAKAIVVHENGVQPYCDAIYQSGYELISGRKSYENINWFLR